MVGPFLTRFAAGVAIGLVAPSLVSAAVFGLFIAAGGMTATGASAQISEALLLLASGAGMLGVGALARARFDGIPTAIGLTAGLAAVWLFVVAAAGSEGALEGLVLMVALPLGGWVGWPLARRRAAR
jgi:hypothetical protein